LGSPVDGAESDARAVVLLTGARDELAELTKLRPDAIVAQGSLFRRPALERALRSKKDCLHIATHLVVKAGEPRSRFPAAGLRLDDGDVMSAREIADLTPSMPLVVLSACETGSGRYADGEGLFGVARAFLEGGTRNLVVTLWPVEDGAAREFAIAFHRALASGAAPSQAARMARSILVAQERPTADWAAFRFLGRD
jgi:CHAT domain-containing protein